MIELFVILMFIVYFVYKIISSTSSYKGKVGERKVNSKLKFKLNRNYTIYQDLTFRLKGGRTTQVDHVVLSPYGIFVIETKNMKGWIFGSEKQKKWTQVIYREKNHFQNPIFQNYRHLKTISDILNVNEKSLHSVIVFIGDSKFKTQIPNNVFNNGKYISYIKSFKDKVFNDTELQQMKVKIEKNSVKDKNIDKEHINNLKNKKIIDKITCKKCGSPMVKRTNRNTNEIFLGCSNYPKCRNIEKV